MTSTDPTATRPWEQQRGTFVNALYRLQENVDRGGYPEADARRQLARLRRSFAGSRQQADAYDFVFRHDPPKREQEIWLLLAGLFAIYPQRRPGNGRRSFGTTMRDLTIAKDGGGATERRFIQLLSARTEALPHYLRQCVQLARGQGARIDFDQLLDDLVALSGDDPDRAHQTRLRWARDYHRQPYSRPPAAETSEEAQLAGHPISPTTTDQE